MDGDGSNSNANYLINMIYQAYLRSVEYLRRRAFLCFYKMRN